MTSITSFQTQKQLLFLGQTSSCWASCLLIVNTPYLSAESKKLEEMIRDLSSSLTSVKHEQEYMEVRERVHRLSKIKSN